MLLQRFRLAHSSFWGIFHPIWNLFKIAFPFFIWPTKYIFFNSMPWLYGLIRKSTKPTFHSRINSFCFVDSSYIVQSNQPRLQVSVKEGDIPFSSRGRRVLQFQRSCYLPSISVSSFNQNIIPQKPFTYVGHCLLSRTCLCFINL